jgi:hypothetical protein
MATDASGNAIIVGDSVSTGGIIRDIDGTAVVVVHDDGYAIRCTDSDLLLNSAVGGGASDHGALTGLTDDDHTQYLLTSGTRSMAGNLDMDGNSLVGLAAGSAGAPSVSADADATLGLFFAAAKIGLAVGGAEVAMVNATGFGVGKTPTELVDIQGATSGSSFKMKLAHTADTLNSNVTLHISSGGTSGGDPTILIDQAGSNPVTIGIDKSSSSVFRIAPVAALTGSLGISMQPDGDIGIGTAAPQDMFHISTTGAADAFRVDDSSGRTYFNTSSGVDTMNAVGGAWFKTSGGATIARFKSDGKLGVGTSSAQRQFHAYHATDNAVMRVESGDANVSLEFLDSNTTTIPIIRGSTNDIELWSGGAKRLGVESGGRIYMRQASTTSGAPVIELDQSDESEEFIEFDGTEAATTTTSLSTLTTSGAVQGHIQITINGTKRWLAYSADPS